LEVGFEKLSRAQERKRCVFETGIDNFSVLPHCEASRTVVRVVAMRTDRDLDPGDLDRAIGGVETVLRLARDLRPRGGLICQLVSFALDNASVGNIVPSILRSPGITTEHCDRLLALLITHESEGADPFEGHKAEYLRRRKLVHDIEHRKGPLFDAQLMKQAGIEGNTVGERLVAKEERPEWPSDFGKQGKQVDAILRRYTQAHFAHEAVLLNRYYRSLLGLADRPYHERPQAIERLEQDAEQEAQRANLFLFLYSSPAIGTIGAFENACWKRVTILRGTQCLIALKRWQLEHDGLPENLLAAVKAAGMPAVPIDPFSGQPLRMTTIEGQPVIYSVGRDGQDDKALVEYAPGQSGDSRGDILFRLEPEER
jgi:hypothetical protein